MIKPIAAAIAPCLLAFTFSAYGVAEEDQEVMGVCNHYEIYVTNKTHAPIFVKGDTRGLLKLGIHHGQRVFVESLAEGFDSINRCAHTQVSYYTNHYRRDMFSNVSFCRNRVHVHNNYTRRNTHGFRLSSWRGGCNINLVVK